MKALTVAFVAAVAVTSLLAIHAATLAADWLDRRGAAECFRTSDYCYVENGRWLPTAPLPDA